MGVQTMPTSDVTPTLDAWMHYPKLNIILIVPVPSQRLAAFKKMRSKRNQFLPSPLTAHIPAPFEENLKITISDSVHKKLFPIFQDNSGDIPKIWPFWFETMHWHSVGAPLIFDAFGFVCKNSSVLKKEGANVKNKYAIVLGEKCISQLGAFKGLN